MDRSLCTVVSKQTNSVNKNTNSYININYACIAAFYCFNQDIMILQKVESTEYEVIVAMRYVRCHRLIHKSIVGMKAELIQGRIAGVIDHWLWTTHENDGVIEGRV